MNTKYMEVVVAKTNARLSQKTDIKTFVDCWFELSSPAVKIVSAKPCTIRYRVWQAEAVLQPATRIRPQPNHTETPTHIETRKHNQCGDTIEKSQAPDDGCINIRNMLSIEEVK